MLVSQQDLSVDMVRVGKDGAPGGKIDPNGYDRQRRHDLFELCIIARTRGGGHIAIPLSSLVRVNSCSSSCTSPTEGVPHVVLVMGRPILRPRPPYWMPATKRAHAAREQLADGLDDDPIVIPANDRLTALIGVLPLQLIAYELAVLKGINPDTPRNLAKVRVYWQWGSGRSSKSLFRFSEKRRRVDGR